MEHLTDIAPGIRTRILDDGAADGDGLRAADPRRWAEALEMIGTFDDLGELARILLAPRTGAGVEHRAPE